MALPFGGSAMSAAESTTSLTTDQRGAARPAGGRFDIGAFQVCRRAVGVSLMPAPCGVFTNGGSGITEPLTIQVSPAATGSTGPAAGQQRRAVEFRRGPHGDGEQGLHVRELDRERHRPDQRRRPSS
jgi:hypothetical protein